MLEIRVFVNSAVGEVLAFKCCALPDQNLEIHLRNTGDRPVVLSGFFVVENASESREVANVYPPGAITVPPQDVTAVYSYMDSSEWERYETITFFEPSGKAYRFPARARPE
jgi:hypothetical protein